MIPIPYIAIPVIIVGAVCSKKQDNNVRTIGYSNSKVFTREPISSSVDLDLDEELVDHYVSLALSQNLTDSKIPVFILRAIYPVTIDGNQIPWPSVSGDSSSIKLAELFVRRRTDYVLAKIRYKKLLRIINESIDGLQ